MKYFKNNKQQGFSIVELLISLTVGLFLLAGVLSVFVSMKTTSSEVSRYGALQENGRFAISLLSDELLRAGFWGDYPTAISASNLTSFPAALSDDCVGGGSNNSSFPVTVGYFRSVWGHVAADASAMGCIDDAKLTSDILQVKRVISNPIAVGDLDTDRYYLYTNYNAGEILTKNQTPTVVIPNPRYWEYQHHVFYINEQTVNGVVTPTLMQSHLEFDASEPIKFEPLVDGIEHIHFLYGVDTDGDQIVNGFYPADEMTNDYWDSAGDSHIIAVKVYLIVRDLLPDLTYENKDSFLIGDRTIDFMDDSGNGDNFHRLMFSTTVSLFNTREETWP